MYFFTLKFSPMFSRYLVPCLLVTVLLCEKVDIFTVRPSGPSGSTTDSNANVFLYR